MPAVLDEILISTRERVAHLKRTVDRGKLEAAAARHQPRGFRTALERAAVLHPAAVIAEIKKASPSKGVIRGTLHVAALARDLEQAGAAALSVLTEERYFQGSMANLCEASAATSIPCLCKDFIIDELQLVEAKANRADAVLLIASALRFEELSALRQAARKLVLDVLCEVHDEVELQRAIEADCDIIGVNSRDLMTFNVDLGTAVRISARMPSGVLRVAESGIASGHDVRRLRAAGFDAFLIGETLMRAERPGEALGLLFAEAKKDSSSAWNC
jgi:indole-3-glycerol phosphate synthase